MTDPLFSPGARLPRGPHSLSREDVGASQRLRLLRAVTDLAAEQGYGAVTMGALATRAGVSRGAFYEHFADKEACFLAAYDHFASELAAAVLSGLAHDPPWEEFIDGALRAYLGTLDRDPAAARAFIIEMEGAGPAARARRRETMRTFAALVAGRHAAMRERDPKLGALPARAHLGLVLGVRELVREALESGQPARLGDLREDIVTWITAMIAGAPADRG